MSVRSWGNSLNRRFFLQSMGAGAAVWLSPSCSSVSSGCRLASFSADVTVPLGHGLLAGVIEPARKIVDPLFAHGIVLLPEGQPSIVVVGVDWCEIRNDAHERWRVVLAEAAETLPERVIVSSLHQHDAPVMDLEAQRLLDEQGLTKLLCDAEFHENALQKVAAALRESLATAQPVTHTGTGQARVRQVASNRRVELDGEVVFDRSAITTEEELRALPEGLVDPWLKSLSFWNGDRALAVISCYAVHPITYYGQGEVSWDYVGAARAHMQRDHPNVAQIYLTGCAGDVTAGKYNDGDPANRSVLAGRVYAAMKEAWEATERYPLEKVAFRSIPLEVPPRTSPGFTLEDQREELADASLPAKTRALAAMGLSWWKRIKAGKKMDVPVIDLGQARLLLLPGETFVQYQLWAQQMRPDRFVLAVGYGDCATGYIPTRQATAEGFDNRRRSIKTWMWADPERSEAVMLDAIADAMDGKTDGEKNSIKG